MEELLHAGVHWSLINFFLFVGILFFFLRKPAKEFWASRAEQIRFSLHESNKLKREAQERYDELKKRISLLETEAQRLVQQMEREGEAEKKRMMEDGEKLAARIREDSARIMAQEVQKARETLKAQTVALSMELAEKMVRENFKDSDQKKLSDEYMTGVEGGCMISGSLPRRYARALIQLAEEAKQLEGFGQALQALSDVLRKTPDFLNVLSNDLIDFNQRLSAMDEIATKYNFPLYLKNFLFILVKKERVELLPEIVREFHRFEDEILGIVRVTVETPSVPDAATLDRVGKILSQKLKKKVIAEGKAVPAMIGGMILKVDHVVYDGSVGRELERIKETMLKG